MNLGAVASLLWEAANELVDRGIEVSVIAGPFSGSRIENPRKGLTVHRLEGREGRAGRQAIRAFYKIQDDVDLVHLHDVLPLGSALPWAVSTADLPKFWTWHNLEPICVNSSLWPPCSLSRDGPINDRSGLCYVDRDPACRTCFDQGLLGWGAHKRFTLSSRLLKALASRYSLIVPSSAAKRVLQKALGLDVRAIPNAVAAGEIGRAVSHRAGLSVAFGGRIVPEKGLDLLMRSLEGKGATLTSYGLGREQHLGALADHARKLGLEYRQEGWLPRDEFLRRLAEHDLCVIPSRGFESFGMIALDAELVGLPLVVSRSGGLVEAAEEGKNAIYYDREDQEALAQAVDILAEDLKKRTKLARLSGRIVTARFSISKHVDRLLEAYGESSNDREMRGR